MKLKYPLINAALQLILLFFYMNFGFVKNFYLNLTILIILLNLASYFSMAVGFKRNFQFLFTFSFFSFLSVIIGLIVLSLGTEFFQHFQTLIGFTSMVQYYSVIGAIKIWLSYFIFSLLPSFLVLSLMAPKKGKVKTKRRLKIKRRK